jgi:ABC-type transporter Mla subunit MlaD
MADADAPRAALASVAAASPNLAAGLAAVRGERDGDLRRLIANVASTADALDDSPSQLMDIVEGGAITLETTARRNGDIRATINGAATILPRVRATLADLDETLVKADGLLDALRPPAGEIAPAIRELRPAVLDTGALLREARPLLGALRPAARALAAAARDGRPLLDELAPSLKRLDETILTDLNKIDPTSKRSTAAMIGPTLSGLLGAASNIDQVAHMVGLGAASSERGITTLPCQTYFTDPTAQQLLTCENLAEALAEYLSYNPLDP